MKWIDTHCHLNHENFGGRAPAEIIQAARNAGVQAMVNISCEIRGDFIDVLATAQAHDGVWCSVGTHPHDAGKPDEKAVTLDELISLARSDEKIIAIGESGLDYYYNHSSAEDQQESFRKHIRACIATDLPLIVHARDADEDIIRIIHEEGAGTALKGVMHCFSSGAKMAQEALELGFYLSFSGMITFNKADDLRAIVKDAPLDRLLVETDAPFLAPMPYRGKTNESAFVIHTGEKMAQIKEISVEDMASITCRNAQTLFDLPL